MAVKKGKKKFQSDLLSEKKKKEKLYILVPKAFGGFLPKNKS